jgi:hypothetical protein
MMLSFVDRRVVAGAGMERAEAKNGGNEENQKNK